MPAACDESGGQHLLFEAVVELLTHVASRTRLVLVVDDLHWVDPASSELIRYVANNLGRVPILLVVTYRAEDAAAERDLIAQLARLASRQIALTPLAEDSTAEMAEILLGPDASPADVRRIAHDADGNPLFVEELVAALGTTGVPQTVRDLMLARFSALDEPSRHLVRTAAVIGATAPQAWLAAAAGLDDNATRGAARAAVDRGLLIAGGDGTSYHFRHALLRQAVLDELLPDERVALHHAIAAALTAAPGRRGRYRPCRGARAALGRGSRCVLGAAVARRRGGASGAELRVRGRVRRLRTRVGLVGISRRRARGRRRRSRGVAARRGRRRGPGRSHRTRRGSRTGGSRRGVRARREPGRRSGRSRVPPAVGGRSRGRAGSSSRRQPCCRSWIASTPPRERGSS